MHSRKTRGSAVESLENRRLLSASAADVVVSPLLTLSPAATTSTPSGYSPAQISRAYGFDSISFNGVKGDGAGQTIAIVDAFNDPNVAADLAVFSSTYGLPAANLTVVSQAGSKTALPKTDAGWAGEIALDVEWAHAMAPAAKILLVEAKSDSLADLLTAVDYARNAAGVSVVSMSWGTSEFFGETSYDSHFTTPAGHIGVTFVAASGDEGQWYGPDWPASSSNVVSVGGTTLVLDSVRNIAGEAPWSDSTGGYSRFETARSYQAAATGSYRRTTPDVAFDADPETGFAVYDSVPYQGVSGWVTVGGTSAGAPQWAALVAIANQGRSINGQGSLDGASGTLPALYSLYNSSSTAYASAFNDVTDTTRQLVWGGRRVGWVVQNVTADVGYDTATGLGTPEAAQVVSTLVGAKATAVTAVRKSARVTVSRRVWRADEVATAAAIARETDGVRPAVSAVAAETTSSVHVENVMATLPKVTFVLAPVGTTGPAGAVLTPPTVGGTVVGDVTTAVSAPSMVRIAEVVEVRHPEVEVTTTMSDASSTVSRVIAARAERVVVGAGAVLAAAVAGVSDAAAADGWGTPVAAAGVVLMFSWAMERATRRRTPLPDAGAWARSISCGRSSHDEGPVALRHSERSAALRVTEGESLDRVRVRRTSGGRCPTTGRCRHRTARRGRGRCSTRGAGAGGCRTGLRTPRTGRRRGP